MDEAARTELDVEGRVLAAELRRNAREADELLEQRNAYFEQASAAGFTSTELGVMFGVQAQTVRHFLRQRGAGPRQTKVASA